VIRLAVRVRREDAELVLAELLELAPSGVEEVALGEDVVEYAVFGAPGELPALPDLRAAAGQALVELSTTEIADDWADRWREFHRPLVLDGKLTVRPPWEPTGGTPIDLVIDPGQAFGTGAHATTRLCLELMLELDAGGPFLDLGCGSGVLAIAAARLGWAPVRALDNDPASVVATVENARRNGVGVDVRRHDLRAGPVPTARTVAANLLAPLLRDLAARLPRGLELPERLIASGLLVGEVDGIAAAFARRGLAESRRRSRGEWAALLLERVDS
jgi:ribosomal protein L11 methyltransferase